MLPHRRRLNLPQRNRHLLQIILIVAHLTNGKRVRRVLVLDAALTSRLEIVCAHAHQLVEHAAARHVEGVAEAVAAMGFGQGRVFDAKGETWKEKLNCE